MKCEYCNKEHSGTYGSGRFCSKECACGFSTKAKRKEINKKVSKKLSERNKEMFKNGWTTPIFSKEIRRKAAKAAGETSHRKWLKRQVKIGEKENGVVKPLCLNITNEELEKYRQSHPVCEICGKEERIKTNPNSSKMPKLAVDHIHGTDKFRGLLCNRCNYLLGWVEEVGIDSLSSYLNKDNPS